MIRAVSLIREHQALVAAKRLYSEARKIPGVVEAYPSLGRLDGVVFVEAKSLRDLNAILHHLQQLSGVESLETLVEETN
ncbi:MAG: Lrp/AsnC ligand binding domain-containing protein [Methanobacteriota archaeon]